MAEKLHQYQRQAAHAERMARTAVSEAEREAYLKIAAVWRELADTRQELMQRQEN
jgi:hypothetical protein